MINLGFAACQEGGETKSFNPLPFLKALHGTFRSFFSKPKTAPSAPIHSGSGRPNEPASLRTQKGLGEESKRLVLWGKRKVCMRGATCFF